MKGSYYICRYVNFEFTARTLKDALRKATWLANFRYNLIVDELEVTKIVYGRELEHRTYRRANILALGTYKRGKWQEVFA